MSGLEKITEHIRDISNSEAAQILADAKKKAQDITSSYDEKAEKMKADFSEKADIECSNILQMALSSDRQKKRDILLKTRNDVIKSVIEEAKGRILSMKSDEYKNVLLTLLKNSLSNDQGEIVFSKRDKEIADSDFINECINVSGGKLSLSDDEANIPSGFIIRYGKVEQNCSIEALFEEKNNELCDLVNSVLIKDQ